MGSGVAWRSQNEDRPEHGDVENVEQGHAEGDHSAPDKRKPAAKSSVTRYCARDGCEGREHYQNFSSGILRWKGRNSPLSLVGKTPAGKRALGKG